MQHSTMLNNYHLLYKLGAGGTGEVWLAEDEYKHKVAIKILSGNTHFNQRQLKRFFQEAQTLSALNHPNLCRIYSIINYNGAPAIIMHYEEGVSLSNILKFLASKSHHESLESPDNNDSTDISVIINTIQDSYLQSQYNVAPNQETIVTIDNRLPLQQSLSLVRKICDAVHYAHERGILHRDIKPSNIIIRADTAPVLVDFGVAKYKQTTQNQNLTATGEFFGTLDYTAPEQIRTCNDVDERADIFSIGVILYELVTGKKYCKLSGDLFQDIWTRENKEPPRPRSIDKKIDKELESIILKAICIDPSQRYRSALSLAQDISNYQNGFQVSATPPMPLYLLRKKIAKHKKLVVAGTVLTSLFLMLTIGALFNYYKQWGRWVNVFEADFTKANFKESDFKFQHRLNFEMLDAEIDSAGLHLPWGHWCWLNNVRVADNVRLKIEMVYDEIPDGFEIVINGSDDMTKDFHEVPKGYSCQVGGYMGIIDFISINKQPGPPNRTRSRISNVTRAKKCTIIFQRVDNTLELIINGKKKISANDIMPFRGTSFSKIGFHTYAYKMRILSVSAYHLSIPEHSSPLTVGQAFMSKGHYQDALETFLTISKDYTSTHLGEEALFGAFVAADELKQNLVCDSIVDMMNFAYPQSEFWQEIEQRQMLALWKNNQQQKVLRLLDNHMHRWPNTLLAAELDRESINNITDRRKLLPWLVKTRGITWIDISNSTPSSFELIHEAKDLKMLSCTYSSLANIKPLKKLSLYSLELSNNNISSIDELTGMPLKQLRIERNKISSLQPIASAPLVILIADNNSLTSLPEFTSTTLKRLYINNNRIKDLEPLRGLRLTHLSIGNNPISSIEPLRGMPIYSLNMGGCTVDDYSVLEGMPIKTLRADSCNISLGLHIIKDLPIRELTVRKCNLRDLNSIPKQYLENINISHNQIRSLSPLIGTPIRILNCSNNRITTLNPVKHLTLNEMDCSNNEISSLEPLRGKKINLFNCQFNNLTSLEPLLDKPPERFYYYSPDLPLNAIDEAIASWEKDPALFTYAKDARIVRALLTDSIELVKQYATSFDGHSYLSLPVRLPFDAALRFCAKFKGYPASLSSNEEIAFVRTFIPEKSKAWINLGSSLQAHNQNDSLALNFSKLYNVDCDNTLFLLTPHGEIKNYSENEEANIIVEWEN